jgi:lycopene cyclase domain-containing protein
VGHLTYLALLAGCLVVTAPLELVLRVRVYARWRRFLLAVLPEFVVFVAWVLYAIDQRHWDYDGERTLGVSLPGGIPVEEVLFFLVVPLCAVLAFEAVRKVTGWYPGYPDPAEEADR